MNTQTSCYINRHEKILEKEGKVLRHNLSVRLIHWLTALSIFSLFFTGFGQMPLYKRYLLTEVQGMAWTGNYGLTLTLHYWGALVLMFAAGYHVVYHIMRKEYDCWPKAGDLGESAEIIKAMLTGGKEPACHKYLAEQRLAYAFIAINVLLLIITGLIKMAKNLPSIYLSEGVVFWSTHLHNLAAVLLLFGVIGHLAAFLIPANRKLLPSMFTGKVDLSYAKERHCLWYEDIQKQK